MTEGEATDGRRTVPWWGVAILVATAVVAVVGWSIDHAADHPAADSGIKGYIVGGTLPPYVEGSPATVVAVTGPHEFVLDIGPMVRQPHVPDNVRLTKAPLLPVGRASVRLALLGTTPASNCHVGEGLQLALTVIKPGAQVMVRAVDVSTSGITVRMWRLDGTDVTTQLIAAGVAPMWVAPNGAVSGDESDATQVAQNEHLGIWAPCPTPS